MIGTSIALLMAGLASGVGSVAAAKMSSNAAKKATAQTTAGNDRAAEVQAKSNADSLAYMKDAEATRKAEWQANQDKSYAEYRHKMGLLEPYQEVGGQSVRTLGNLMQPGSGDAYMVPPARTLNNVVRG